MINTDALFTISLLRYDEILEEALHPLQFSSKCHCMYLSEFYTTCFKPKRFPKLRKQRISKHKPYSIMQQLSVRKMAYGFYRHHCEQLQMRSFSRTVYFKSNH